MSDYDKAALIAELDAARAKIAQTGTSLREAGDAVRRKFDVSARVKESFKNHRPTWLGGAALFGLLLSKLPARKTTVFVGQASGATGKLGAAWGVLKFAGGLAKPFLGDLAAKWLAARMEPTAPPKDKP